MRRLGVFQVVAVFTAVSALFFLPGSSDAQSFTRGDANSDGTYDISDAIFSLSALFVVGSGQPECLDAADSNDDGAFDISDPVYSLSALFVPGSPPPPAPHPACGSDPTADALDCATSPPACPGIGPLPFFSLILDINSGLTTDRTDIIRDAATFEALWFDHFSLPGAPPPPLPVIDFADEMVVVIARPGSLPGNYYWFSDIEVLAGDLIEATYNHQSPPGICVVELTPAPIHVVRCPAVIGDLIPVENPISGCFPPF